MMYLSKVAELALYTAIPIGDRYDRFGENFFRLGGQNMTLADAITTFLSSMKGVKSPATTKWYQDRLKLLEKFIGPKTPIKNITVHHLRNWRASLSDRKTRYENHPTRSAESGGLSRDTLHGYVRSTRRFFAWLVEENLLSNNPAKRFEFPPTQKRPKAGISDRDRKLMLEISKEIPRDYAILMFAGDTGCRAAGIAGLQFKDLDIDRGRATVFEKGNGGNGKGRIVYFLSETKVALHAWLSVRPEGGEFVFTSSRKDGGGLTVSGVYELFKRVAIESKTRGKWSPHQWRHWRARKWAERGMNLGIIAQLMGHTDIKVTSEYYGVFADADLQNAHERYSHGDSLQ